MLFEPFTLSFRSGRRWICSCRTAVSPRATLFCACRTARLCSSAMPIASLNVMRFGACCARAAPAAASATAAGMRILLYNTTASCSMTTRSLVTECLNWVETGRLFGRVIPEEHTHGAGERDRDDHGRRRSGCCPPSEMPEQRRPAETDGQPNDAAEQTHDHALDEKLREHV